MRAYRHQKPEAYWKKKTKHIKIIRYRQANTCSSIWCNYSKYGPVCVGPLHCYFGKYVLITEPYHKSMTVLGFAIGLWLV